MEIEVRLPKELIDAVAAMSPGSAWYESGAAIAVFSGLIAVLGGVVSHLFNQRSESKRRESERKIMQQAHDNRKVEKMHDTQVEALKVLSLINENLLPTVWPNPDYDAHEAYSGVVWKMYSLLNELDDYLKEWSYVLPENIISQVRNIIFLCNEEHWGATTAPGPDYEPSEREIKFAGIIVGDLAKVISDLKQLLGMRIHNQ